MKTKIDPKLKYIVIYHNADLDGKCSGALLRNYINNEYNFEPTMIGSDYSTMSEQDKERLISLIDNNTVVYMADYSIEPFSYMNSILDKCNKFILLDHHQQSAIWAKKQKSENLISVCKPDDKVCAAEITWNFLYPKKRIPKTIKMIGDYDTFRNPDDRDALLLTIGVPYLSIPDNPNDNAGLFLWKQIVWGYSEDLQKEIHTVASAILKQQNIQIQDVLESIEIVEWENLKWYISNTSVKANSFLSKLDTSEIKYVLTYHRVNKQWAISMRSVDNKAKLDKIAEKFGGGGHSKAAGFTSEQLPFPL